LGPPSRVVSYAGNSVEELPEGANVSFDGAAFGFRQEAPSSFDRDGSRDQHPHQHTGRLNAPSQAFAAMLEAEETGGAGGGRATGDAPASPLAGVVAKAIQIYETNAKVVGGESNILGTSVSLVL